MGAAATYLEVQQPHIWFTAEIKLTQPQVELELGLSLAIAGMRKTYPIIYPVSGISEI